MELLHAILVAQISASYQGIISTTVLPTYCIYLMHMASHFSDSSVLHAIIYMVCLQFACISLVFLMHIACMKHMAFRVCICMHTMAPCSISCQACKLVQAIWDPRLAFTGTTILGVNPKNGELFVRSLHALPVTYGPIVWSKGRLSLNQI